MYLLRPLLFAACLWCATSPFAQSTGCGPLPLGSPCATGGLATAGSPGMATNLSAGNPINWLSGNKYQRDTDLAPHADYPGIELVRHYNSQDSRQSALGQGWSFSYDTRLVQAGGRWQIAQADGSNIAWEGSVASPAPGLYGTLKQHIRGWVWQWPNGQKLWFDQQGLLYYMTLPQGHGLRIVRDGKGRLHRVENSLGAWMLFRYFAAPSHVQVSTPRGTFRYGGDTPTGVKHPTQRQPGIQQQDAVQGSRNTRLRFVERPDGMVRYYHYETQHQAGWPHALTGISLISSDGLRQARQSTWRYDDTGRAIAWHAGHSTDANRPSVHLGYAPNRNGVSGTSRSIRTGTGQGINIHLRNGQRAAHASRIDALHCPGCPQGGWPGVSLAYSPTGQLHSWSSALTGTEYWQYDIHDRIQSRRLADGAQTQLRYTPQGQLLQVVNQSSGQRDITRVQWQGSRALSVHHPNETEHLQYDAKGRVTERILQRPNAQASGSTLVWRERYGWTHQGKLQHHWLAEGGRLDYTWSHDGSRLLSLYWQDNTGARHKVIDSMAGTPGYQYGNDLHLNTQLDARGRVHRLLLEQPGHTTLWAARLSYTQHNLVASEHHTYHLGADPAGVDSAGRRHTSAWLYAYNEQKQLIGAKTHAALPAAYTPAHGGATTRSHHETNSPGTPNDDATRWYAWNADGSLAATHQQGQTTLPTIERNAAGLPRRAQGYTLRFGAGRRLAAVSRDNHVLAHYRHNAYGHRIARTSDRQQTHYLYLNRQLVAERSTTVGTEPGTPPAPLVTRRYLYAGLTPVGLIDYDSQGRGQLFFIHSDLTGAPRLLTDAKGQVRWLADYTPTGKASKVLGDMNLLLRLPGQLEDPDTGWHDNLLRTYLPDQGQYLEPDPLGPLPGQQALGYAAQQPRKHVDPTGLILFAFDGTRQDASSSSNIWKLSQAYQDGATYYHRGPGTSLYLEWNALTGADAQQILGTQWQHLLNEIEKHTNQPTPLTIDIVGFSRGAALAREFANRIHQQSPNGYFSLDDDLRGALNACVDLRFMGLFDTVAQFGVGGSNNKQFNLTIAPVWTWVAHAVALHERRWLFPLSTAYDSGAGNVIEAPFIGAHADIGGGQLGQPGDEGPATPGGDLANVALAWMAWQARTAGLVFKLDESDRESTTPVLHDERSALSRQLQNGDRSVLTSTSTTLHAYQHEHARLGQQPREQTERVISREDDWLASPDSAIGTIDMNGYARWLRDTLGWGALPA